MSHSHSSSSSSGSTSDSSDSDGIISPPTPTFQPKPLQSNSKPISNTFSSQDNSLETSWSSPHTFHTLKTQSRFQSPSTSKFDHPELHELVSPHIESFNALFSDDPTVNPTTSLGLGGGLLASALESIPERIVWDGTRLNKSNGRKINVPEGSRMAMKVQSLSVAKPMNEESKPLFPGEVS